MLKINCCSWLHMKNSVFHWNETFHQESFTLQPLRVIRHEHFYHKCCVWWPLVLMAHRSKNIPSWSCWAWDWDFQHHCRDFSEQYLLFVQSDPSHNFADSLVHSLSSIPISFWSYSVILLQGLFGGPICWLIFLEGFVKAKG